MSQLPRDAAADLLLALDCARSQLRYAARCMRDVDEVTLLVNGKPRYSARSLLEKVAVGCDHRADEIELVLDRFDMDAIGSGGT